MHWLFFNRGTTPCANNPSAKNKDGETAAEWARRRGMRDVATRLDQAAAAKQT